ncbi:2'-5'-oligoadenylate synthase-like protein 2 [Phodopus roborovskii]|uniref:Oasl2 protein n=1 Tax=Phodopus roborovskii TaxID=109678 RepID=A0AAU9YUN4_PHORO|nr:2'-5'-oligoadenylate synthase-like protein 2 [Phodopus roborovskii]CAH6778779.1 Oasl2 [Phodopus roborovskii]
MDLTPDLYQTPGDSLEHFVQHSLQPQRDWKEKGKDAWGRVERFFRDQCFRDELLLDQEVKVLKVVKGGSSGKGTTLNHRSDQDMTLFLSCFSSFRHQATYREFIIKFIEAKLLHCRKSLAYNITVVHHRAGNRTPRSLTLEIQPRKNDDVIWMDVLPAYDALGSFSRDSKPDPEIYEDLILTKGNPGEFSPSFTELQRHFVKSRPVKLKNLLRLVKFWYKQYLRSKYRRAALPPKYSLELLTIYAWEMGTESNNNFSLDKGFVALMELLRDYQDICVFWTKYYNFQNEVVRNFLKQQLKGSRPIILDPADPTNNLGSRDGWDLVAREASYCLQQSCCWTGDPRGGWNVPAARDVHVTVKQTGREPWRLWVDPYSPIREMKAQIKSTNGTFGELRISFQDPQGDRQLLSSHKTLSDYGIFSKVTVQVLETFFPEIQVFVKDSSGQSKPYAIHPDATIYKLKEKIEDAGGPYRENQMLMSGNKKLKNSCSLAKLQIKDCDTIQVIRLT